MNIQRQKGFVRTPILENRVFFLCSSCRYCHYLILASPAEELVDEEERHAMECKAKYGMAHLAIQKAHRQ